MNAPKASPDQRNAAHLFSGDAPIETRKDDRLFRRDFAQHVARAAAGWKQPRSLTIGLYGPWGSGKSSILNMVVEELEAGHKTGKFDCPWWMAFLRASPSLGSVVRRLATRRCCDCTGGQPADENEAQRAPTENRIALCHKETGAIVVRFDPWEWSSQDMLFRAFFAVVGKSLPRSGEKNLGRLWIDYGDQLAVCSIAAQSLTASEATAAFSAPITAFIGGLWRYVSNRANYTERQGESPLLPVRQRLRDALKRLSGNLVIIIDDLDRLTPEQMICMIQLIKANAAFPKVVFLVAFDHDTVANGLYETLKVDGREYLEKVIQAPLSIPAVNPGLIRRFLCDRMRSLLEVQEVEREFEWERWEAMWDDSLLHYFTTLRKVNRFLDGYAFQVGLLTCGGCSEVNLADLAALELLRQMEPALYRALPAYSQLFCEGWAHDSPLTDERVRFADLIESTVLPSLPRRKTVQALLAHLFPIVKTMQSGPDPGRVWELADAQARRICNRQFFHVFFQCDRGPHTLSQAELAGIAALHGREDIANFLESCCDRGAIPHLMDNMLLHIPPWQYEDRDLDWIIPLLRIAERLQLSQGVESQEVSALRRQIRAWREGDAQGQLWTRAVEESDALFLPARLVNDAIEDNEGPWALQHHDPVSGAPLRNRRPDDAPEAVRGVIKLLLDRIPREVESNRVHPDPGIQDLLRFWYAWGDAAGVTAWIQLQLEDDRRWRRFISACHPLLVQLVRGLDDRCRLEGRASLRELLRSRLESLGTDQSAREALPIKRMLTALDES